MAYHVSLQSFDGPLDLLLQLVTRSQVDIRDIFVSDITQQFLEHVSAMDPSMDRSGEFLEMAARLIEIKSRKLLPNAEEDEELTEMGEELIRRLEEYRRYKWVANELKAKEEEGRNYYFRLPQEIVQGDLELGNASVRLLQAAFQRLLERSEEIITEPMADIEKDHFTVQEQLFLIRSRILKEGKILFSSLFTGPKRVGELVVTFLALLELIKTEEIAVSQDTPFSDIVIMQRLKEENIEQSEENH